MEAIPPLVSELAEAFLHLSGGDSDLGLDHSIFPPEEFLYLLFGPFLNDLPLGAKRLLHPARCSLNPLTQGLKEGGNGKAVCARRSGRGW